MALIGRGRRGAALAAAPSPRTPKIVFVNRFYWPDESATSQILTDLACALATRGFCVHVVCSRQLHGDSSARLSPDESAAGVVVHRLATTGFGRRATVGRALDYASFYLSCVWALTRMLQPGDVLVAKTDPPLLSLLTAPFARRRRVILINWQQDVFPEVASRLGANPLPPRVNELLARARDASLRAACMNVSIGSRMQQYLAARGIPASKLCIIENWADDSAILPKPASASELRARLGLLDRFVVCYSGNLGRAHEFETLLNAAQLLRDDPAFVFLIIGDGAKMGSLGQAVEAHELENFRFLPAQPRASLADSLAAGDVHLVSLLPELEGLIVPSKLYGILAAARPAIFIGDPDGEVARVLDRAQCGRVVARGDAPGLVDILRRLKSDPDLSAVLGARARQLLVERFGFDRALGQWVSLLEALTASPQPSSAAADTRTSRPPRTGIL